MSDKSFGDHTHRGIVKNPLLSTYVTGLSLEDLTHNAVLLPAAPHQQLKAAQDQQTGPQTRTLAHSSHGTTNYPSGDANSNTLSSTLNTNINLNPLETNNTVKNEKTLDVQCLTQSKATLKSDDDFDVSEYFARLQGTRYVSAPLNSHLKEDQNANLDATEENLEEINLNEEKSQNVEDLQQSLTADIAQNFSQLPTVLPQMASVVFSSFSNMLSLKSREQTPDEGKSGCVHQEMSFGHGPESTGVSLGVADYGVREVAPPPKEPPISGVGMYRIATKKKAYAQVPGLTGDAHAHAYAPPPVMGAPPMSTPSFFIPAAEVETAVPESKPLAEECNDPTSKDVKSCNVFNSLDSSNVTPQGGQRTNALDEKDTFFMPVQSVPNSTAVQERAQNNQSIKDPQGSNAAIIPPPPMFSNAPRKDGQTPVGKSILPPSVARRISANQPIIKRQNATSVAPVPDIFVPAPVNADENTAPASTQEIVSSSTTALTSNAQSFVPLDIPPVSTPIFSSSSIVQPGFSTSMLPSTNLAPPSIFATTSIPQIDQTTPSAVSTSLPTIPPTNVDQILMFTPNQSQPIVPPTFFNPTSIQAPSDTFKEAIPVQNTQSSVSPYFPPDDNSKPKPIPEPPKVSATHSYRMTKKRPQYYSGPIEGVGAISNNVKPVLASMETSVFHGALLTPEQQAQVPIQDTGAQTSDQSSTPFDISRPVENVGSYPSYELNESQDHIYTQPSLSTAFDLSRQTTESYEPPKQESKGFGIIGSLKSKLSSLDINKIQSSVTTFFDPAYNDSKVATTDTKDNAPYQQYQNSALHGQNQQIQGNNFEIFVPNIEQTYGQDCNYQSPNLLGYDQGSQYTQYYQNQNNYYQTQQNVYPSYYSNTFDQQQIVTEAPVSAINLPTSTSYLQKDAAAKADNYVFNVTPNTQEPNPVTLTSYPSDNLVISDQNTNTSPNAVTEKEPLTAAVIEPSLSDKSFFDDQKPLMVEFKHEELVEKISNLKNDQAPVLQTEIEVKSFDSGPIDLKHDETQSLVNSALDFFSLHKKDICLKKEEYQSANCGLDSSSMTSLGSEIKEKPDSQNVKESTLPKNDMIANVASVSIFDLSDILADKSKELAEMEREAKEDLATEKNVEMIFNREASSSFFDDLDAFESKLDSQLAGSTSDLNICETCREVNKPETEERDVEDLTTQLIENITSPIQLLNPVEVPLTESNPLAESCDDFNTNQCAEISQITEETIKSNQMQSANELLDDVDDTSSNKMRSYGWCTEDDSFPSPKTLHDQDPFQPDPSAIGFFGNSSLFFDNIPNNASDEIKAEFKNSHEDILPRQMSIPSAPPAEDFDDTKSDETGVLDVHSIEQDAKKDFPIFEEFVIEPSETDDDKIEFREKERSSDDSTPDADTFTNRVERFKKMEETTSDGFEGQSAAPIFDLPKTNSPAITIASYFDTGNYAAETHYKNSLFSPNVFNVGSPNVPLSIPPGFEGEFRRRLSEMSTSASNVLNEMSTSASNVQKVPDTTTQTKTSPTLTFCSTSIVETKNVTVDSVKTTESEVKPSLLEYKLPEFASVFGGKKEETTEKTSEGVTMFSIPKEVQEQQKTEQSLPDPINFFTSSAELPKRESSEETSFNRLASYFTSTKIDHSKSFFDLSQSQGHYRQGAVQNKTSESNSKDHGDEKLTDINYSKNFFELGQSQNHYMDTKQNIANLMKDLTSCQNMEPQEDQTVRSVNYFTVEYNNKTVLSNDYEIGEPGNNKTVEKEIGNCGKSERDRELEETQFLNDSNAISIINACKHCCNLKIGVINKIGSAEVGVEFKNFKVRKATGGEDSVAKKDYKDNMDQSKNSGRKPGSIHFESSFDDENEDSVSMVTESRPSTEYTPVKYHWFYRVDYEGKSTWRGFSVADSKALEEAFHSPELNETTLVPTDGGRFDVNVVGRIRTAVYWSDKPTNVRRCSWFYQGNIDARYVPYTEAIAEKLEAEYRHGMTTGEWHRRLALPNNEMVVMHGPTVIVHFLQSATTDSFTPPAQSTIRPRVVRRGCDESEIEDSEPSSIDHLLLLCHGVGSACDMRFRPVEEVVDDFRATSLQLIQSHYRNSYDNGIVGRVEVLPISWHATLHQGESGVDKRLAQITLDSIPRLRNFTNDTVLDVLFYTSPIFCQTIIDTVCSELNRIYSLFKARNPSFKGGVSLGGHSLGSVILYDLLRHQTSNEGSPTAAAPQPQVSGGPAGPERPAARCGRLRFAPDALYALGSPIAIFECIRGVESLGKDFALPTCKGFFNIFHPYDPIAYRLEPLIDPQLKNVKPFQIPHHKGRKRMHLELKDTMARVGADIKQKLIESIKSTWSSMWRTQPLPTEQLEKVVEEEMEKEQMTDESVQSEKEQTISATPEMLGKLNGGRRVDYVLQEAPFEMINEYLFAMSSHVCYWESEDTMLLILREIYDSLGVQPDSTVPQQSMTVQRTRAPRVVDETIVLSTSDFPSTSHGSS